MKGNNFDILPSQRFYYGRHFVCQHHEIPCNRGFIACPLKGHPGVESCKCAYSNPMVHESHIRASDGDLVDASIHPAAGSQDFVNRRRIEIDGGRVTAGVERRLLLVGRLGEQQVAAIQVQTNILGVDNGVIRDEYRLTAADDRRTAGRPGNVSRTFSTVALRITHRGERDLADPRSPRYTSLKVDIAADQSNVAATEEFLLDRDAIGRDTRRIDDGRVFGRGIHRIQQGTDDQVALELFVG